MDNTIVMNVSKVTEVPEGFRWSPIKGMYVRVGNPLPLAYRTKEEPIHRDFSFMSDVKKFAINTCALICVFALVGFGIQKSVAFNPDSYTTFVESIPRNVDKCQYLTFMLKAEPDMSYQRALARKAFKESCNPTKE